MRQRRTTQPSAGGRGHLRIIGGRWRGRKLHFSAAPGLRPTADRVRETLFNWLAPIIEGAHCADLFAGSGAMGLEALSRGADHCHFVEPSARAAAQIDRHLCSLDCSDGTVHRTRALDFLHHYRGRPFDIVFMDPPFGETLAAPCLRQLGALLAPSARIYLEQGVDEPDTELPAGWQCLRDRQTGQVRYQLLMAAPEPELG